MSKNSDINYKAHVSKRFPSNYSSAEEIVPLLLKATKPQSVIDVGCGMGVWLKAFEKNGVTDIVGIDGIWIKNENPVIEWERIICHDLEDSGSLRLGRKYDLAISLETAEHISGRQANNFVNFLVSLSDVVFFGAATPNSGGQHHVNERWQSYWCDKFKKRGYVLVDYIRPKVWNNKKVLIAYAQDSFLFVKQEKIEEFPQLQEYANREVILDIVHPDLFTNQVVKPSHEWNYLLSIKKRTNAAIGQKAKMEMQSIVKGIFQRR